MLQIVRVFGEEGDCIVATNSDYVHNLVNGEVISFEELIHEPEMQEEYLELVKLCREYGV